MEYTASHSPFAGNAESLEYHATGVKRKLHGYFVANPDASNQVVTEQPSTTTPPAPKSTDIEGVSATSSPVRVHKDSNTGPTIHPWVSASIPSTSGTPDVSSTKVPPLLPTAADSNGTSLPSPASNQKPKKARLEEGVEDPAQPSLDAPQHAWDPARSMASIRHEFGEHGGVNMSIENSATFTVMRPEQMSKIFKGEVGPEDDAFVYSRHYNPTVMHLGRQLAALEGTEAGYCTASGMSAISAALLQLANSGDNIVASNRLYGGSYALLAQFLPKKCGITTSFVDITDLDAVERAIIASPSTRVLFFESVSNPTLVVADIPRLSVIAHKYGVKVVVDNTFAPVLLTPARLGADVIVHSISKFISGGSDIIAGCVCGPEKMISAMMDIMEGPFMIMGATMNPQVAFQISTRLPHLPLRMREHGERASVIADVIQRAGLPVVYPGLPSHPQYALFRSMANPGYGSGGMITVDLETSEKAYEFMDHLQNGTQFGYMAVSLGFHDTLMSCSGASTSSEMGSEALAAVGISPGLVRVSVGFSGVLDQRLTQLKRTLADLGYAKTL